MDYKNEAAERLRRLEPTDPYEWSADIDAALAEERRHVIEQIKLRMARSKWIEDAVVDSADIEAILDDLSTLEQNDLERESGDRR